MSKQEAPTIEDVTADVNHQLQRVLKAKAVETKAELVNNVYPLLLSVIEAFSARALETEEVVAGILGETESIVQPELYEEITKAFNVGRELVSALDGALAALTADGTLDELTHKRLQTLSAAFTEQTNVAETLVTEVALEEAEFDANETEGDE